MREAAVGVAIWHLPKIAARGRKRRKTVRKYGPSQKIGNVGQVANLPKTRQIGN
jgi:hypothetical protein